MIKRLLSNKYVLTLGVKVGSLCMGILSGALLARFLGPAIKGQFASLESVAQVLSVIMNFGIYHLYPKMIKDGIKNARQKFIDIFSIQFLIYTLLILILFVITRDVVILYYGIIAIIGCLVAQLTMMCMVEFPVYRSLSLLGVSFFNMVATIVIYVLDVGHGLSVPVILYLVKDGLFCLLVLLKLKVVPHPFQVDVSFVVQLVKTGFVPMVTALLLKLNYKVDVFMLNLYQVADSQIGIYSIGISLASQLWIIPEAFKEVLYSKSTEKNSEKAFALSVKVSFYALIAIACIIALIGQPLIGILYGEAYYSAYGALIILVIGVPFMGIFNIVNPYYLSLGQYDIHLKNLLLGIVSNIICNSLLISSLGNIGAAIATSVSQIVCGIYACYQFSKSSAIPIKNIAFIGRNDIKTLTTLIRRK